MNRTEYRKNLLGQLGIIKEFSLERKTGANIKLTMNDNKLGLELNSISRMFKTVDHNYMYLKILEIIEQSYEIIDGCKNSVYLTPDRKNTKEFQETFDTLTIFMRALYNSIFGLEELIISYKSDLAYVEKIKKLVEDINDVFQKNLQPYFIEKFGNIQIGENIYSDDLFKNINLRKL